MIVKWCQHQRAAELWAGQFTYARQVSNLSPLQVVFRDDNWAVENPDYPWELYEIDSRGRVVRKGLRDRREPRPWGPK